MKTSVDIKYLDYAVQLALNGYGHTAPNPMVGAVLVYKGRIIGEGWHRQYGQAHAEVNCIQSVSAADQHLIAQSTLYVTLEPCNHFGKTPPCSHLVVDSKIPHVVIGSVDNFEKVNGTGIAFLQEHHVRVDVVHHPGSYQLNQAFFHFHKHQRPFVTLKWAQTQNAFMGTLNGERLYVSNALSQRWVHWNRWGHQAILVGAHTIQCDDPLLNVRLIGQPDRLIKIIWDKEGRLTPHYKVFKATTQPIYIITENQHLKETFQALSHVHVVMTIQPFIESTFELCHSLNCISLYVEGGRTVLNSFLQEQAYNAIHLITSNKSIRGDYVKAPTLPHELKLEEHFFIEDDEIKIFTK